MSKQKISIAEAKFIYESGILSKTPRSGLWFLGTGSQSVAEHSWRTAVIAFVMCHFEPKINREKTVLMALFHDIGEGRTSDLNYVHQKYGRLAEDAAVKDISGSFSGGSVIHDWYSEMGKKETLEAQIAKDADQLEWLCTLREEEVKGNIKAKEWIPSTKKRMKTKIGRQLAALLVKLHPDDWWFSKTDQWFVGRKTKDKKWN